VRRPGGSALNAGQAGGLRAASYIAGFYLNNDPWFGPAENGEDFNGKALRAAAEELAAFERGLRLNYPAPGKQGGPGITEKLRQLQEINSGAAGFLRNKGEVEKSLARIEALDRESLEVSEEELDAAFKYREILLLSRMLHQGIWYYLESGGLSRGSCAVTIIDDSGIRGQAERGFPTDTAFHDRALITRFDAATNSVRSLFRPVRPIPAADLWFEKVWADYREGAIFRPSAAATTNVGIFTGNANRVAL
jgi:hypothetical protein